MRLGGILRTAALAGLASALPVPAEAHLVGVEFGAFYAGALHLTLGFDYVALLLAVVLLAALQDRERSRWVLAALPAGLVVGVLAAPFLPADTGTAELPAIAAGLAVIAGLGVAAVRLGAAPLAVLTGLAGLILGAANGISVIDAPATDPWLYGAGVVTAGTVLGTLGVAAASVLAGLSATHRLGARVACSWLATLGVLLLGLGASGQL